MSERTAESGVAEWIALRRAHEGGVATLQGHWLDSGRLVPSCVADALDRLVSAGLLALGKADLESCGVRRVTVTDPGCAHYVALCQVHDPRARVAVSTPRRWAYSPGDQRSHLLTQCGPDQVGVLAAVCGHRLLWSVATSDQPTGRACPTCEALPVVLVPAPHWFRRLPHSGGPSVEQSPPPLLTPGGQPDTTAPVPAHDDSWRDAHGTLIPQECRIEQVAVDKILGAAPSRLHQQGQVVDRGLTRLFVRFDNENDLVRIRPHLVRVLEAPGEC